MTLELSSKEDFSGRPEIGSKKFDSRELDEYFAERDFSKLRSGETSSAYMERTREHFEELGRAGSADYVEAYYNFSILLSEADLMREGALNSENMADFHNLPQLIDMEKTTPEMLSEGKVVPAEGVYEDLLFTANRLSSKINTHIATARREKINTFVEENVKLRTFFSKFNIFGKQAIPGIHLTPNDNARFNRVLSYGYADLEHAQTAAREELEDMAKARPGIIGYGISAGVSAGLVQLSRHLTREELDLNELKKLFSTMSGAAMDELGIHRGYADAIRQSVSNDITEGKNHEKREKED